VAIPKPARFPPWIAWSTALAALAFGAGREWGIEQCRQDIAEVRLQIMQMMSQTDVIRLINDMRPGPPWVQERGKVLQMLDEHQRALDDVRRKEKR
jgi:hypothetical protein